MTDVKQFLDSIYQEGKNPFDVCHRKVVNGKSFFSKWIPYQDWKYATLPNYRTLLPNEMLLETDYKKKEANDAIAKEMMNKMAARGIPFYAFYTGNKSTHIHFFVQHPKYQKDIIARNKKLIIKHIFGENIFDIIDTANLGERRMIQIEYSINPKTGQPSQLVRNEEGNPYKLPKDLMLYHVGELKDKATKLFINKKEILNNKAPRYCPFIEFCCTNELPTMDETHPYSRNQYIAPNVAAYVLANKEKSYLFERYYESQKSQVRKEWLGCNPEFNCKMLQDYAEKNNITKFCDICKKHGLYDKYRTYIAVKGGLKNETW